MPDQSGFYKSDLKSMRTLTPKPMYHLCATLFTALLLWSSIVNLSAAENKIALNLEPTHENPRNSEGAFITLKSGRILFIYTQFRGGSNDDSPAHIVSIYSDDLGATWNQKPEVVIENRLNQNVMSVSLLRLRNGSIALFYLDKTSWQDCRAYVQFSTDEAQSWSKPQLVIAAPGYFVMNNDRVIQLSTGRLVAPVAFHRSRNTQDNGHAFDSRAIDFWYLSDDEGRTWRESDSWWALPVVSHSGLQEPGVVELANGEIFSWSRTDQGVQYSCTSTNNGKTWSAPAPSSLQSPTSPASLKRLPDSPDLLAIYNDHSGQFTFPNGKRTPLVAAISSDGGRSWPVRKIIEADPDGWYCYTAIHFTGDSVLLAYCAGDSKIGGLNRLRIRRLSLSWLREK